MLKNIYKEMEEEYLALARKRVSTPNPEEDLKEMVEESEKEKEEIIKEDPYYLGDLANKGYKTDSTGVYAPYMLPFYLKLSREDKKTFSFGFYKETSENTFKQFSQVYTKQKPIIEEDSKRNQAIDRYTKDKGMPQYKRKKDNLKRNLTICRMTKYKETPQNNGKVTEWLKKVALDIIRADGLAIIKDKHYYPVETETNKEKDNREEIKKSSSTPKSFEDYPPHIQKLAKEILTEDDLLKRICNTTSYRVGGNETEIKLLTCGASGLFVGAGVNTLANGQTGTGKSKLVYEVLKNFPDTYIYHLNTSPKYIFRDAENLQGYKIIVANDIPLTLANMELIKSLTREEDVISYKTLEGDKTGKQTRLELELTGKYIVIMTFAKNTPDEELANPFFNLNIAPNEEEKGEIKGKIKEQNNMDTLHHKGYNLANEVNKCAMQYLIDKNFTVFNPYSLFVNPVSLNNRDVNNIFNFVKGLTFFKHNKRCTISLKGKQVCLGSFEDLKEILELWEDTEEVQKYKLDSIQEEILKVLPTLSEDEAETEANKYEDDDFVNFNRNAKRKTIDDDIEKCETKALYSQLIAEKIGRDKVTINRGLYYEEKNNNKSTLLSLGLVGYYETYIGGKYPRRMFYRKQKCSNSSKSMLHMFQKESETYVDMLKVKQKVLISLMICFNILVNMYIEEKILSYCSNNSDNISSYDGMCNFITGFITKYEKELQLFDIKHISLDELDYHNNILIKNNSLGNLEGFLKHIYQTTNNTQNSNQGKDVCFKSEMKHMKHTKTENEAISEKQLKSKSDGNALNRNQDKVICFKSELEQINNVKSELEKILLESGVDVVMGTTIIEVVAGDDGELTRQNIQQQTLHKLGHHPDPSSDSDPIILKFNVKFDKLLKTGLLVEKFTSGRVYCLGDELKSILANEEELYG